MLSFIKIKSSVFTKQLAVHFGIIGGVLIVLIILLFIFNGQVAKESLSVQNLRQQIQTTSYKAELFSKLIKDFQIFSPYIESVRNLLPTRDKLIDFSQQLSDLAKANNLDFGFVFQEESLEAKTPDVAFSMTLQGDFSNLTSFLQGLKKFPYYVSLESFNISGPPIDEIAKGSQSVSIVVHGRVFTSGQ